MKALVLHRYGGPDAWSVTDWPEPTLAAGEVEIDVHAAGVNPVDFKSRERKAWPIMRPRLPVVAGNECAGVVSRVGSGVTRFAPGDRVLTRVHKSSLGAFAEKVCVPEALVAKLPDGVGMREGAGLPLVGLTAFQCLFEVGGLKSGERIFIQVGAGGVGTIAIQLAKRAGAHVITTASGKGAELCRRLGADEVIDYKTKRWQDAVRDVDLVLDALGGEALFDAFEVVKPGGRVVSLSGNVTRDTAVQTGVPLVFHPVFWALGRPALAAAKKRGVRYAYWFMREDGAQLQQLADLVDKKELEVVIDRVFPLAEAKEAVAYVEAGHAKGKVIIEVPRR